MTTCPTCRTVCESPPVRDRSNGLISLISSNHGAVEPFDADRFVALMEELRREAEEKRAKAAQEVMMVDYVSILDAGTVTDPLDLTGVWN